MKMFEQKNSYPVVLVPGVFGYGDNAKLSKHCPYFGTVSASVEKTLKSLGMDSFTPSFGPLSGIWDRTCELYAQIVGGTVDYGAAHSEKYGTERFGRHFDGFYPEWGEKDSKGNPKKITLLAHGFGAPVARLLVYLMANGSEKEKRAGGNLSPLFEGGHEKTVHAVVTLAGVNDGTTFFQALDYRLPGTIKALTTAGFACNDLYTLRHYLSLRQRASLSPCGSLIQFNAPYSKADLKKMVSVNQDAVQRYMSHTRDNIFYELGLDGMTEFNKCLRIDPDTYYLSLTGEVTKDYGQYLPKQKVHKLDQTLKKARPQKEIILPAKCAGLAAPSAALISTFKNFLPDGPLVTEELFPNDGAVNTNTSLAPSTEPMENFRSEENCYPGTWYQMPIEKNNHFDFIGMFQRPDEYRDYIVNLMKVICNLETA